MKINIVFNLRRYEAMQTKLFSFGLGVFLAVVAGCGSNDNSSVKQNELTEDGAKQKASAYVPGTVGDTKRVATGGQDVWDVTIAIPGGGEAVVELEHSDGSLDSMTSEKGPFDYDLPSAGPDLLLYKKAHELVLAAKPGDVERWELNIGEKIWEFYMRDPSKQLWEVKLDMKTGALISAVQKDHAD
jgi:uncharacterized membrane protein YkoI